MARTSRVLSFISQFSIGPAPNSPTKPPNTSSPSPNPHNQSQQAANYHQPANHSGPSSPPPNHSEELATSDDPHRYSDPSPSTPPEQLNASSTSLVRRTPSSRPNSRPVSMVQTFQPPLMEVAEDTLPELQPIFRFLNSHSNKLYHEGYFLKLHDLDSRGRPSVDRAWQECFAQLCGTVLSLWDAAALDAAGVEGEVPPTFVNMADASIKVIESLPMSDSGQALQNVLSVSTAANNRYLLHFNSLNSLTQWAAAIRLALFEHSSLQEAYTGSLIAGKGRVLNNIRQIMERNRMKQEDWARVRFGAGTPWRRCWYVISPPDEKEYQKAHKQKKKTSYEKPPTLKGDLKFYESKKITKKTKPIATITDSFSAYAVYPQSKPLIDQSTLVKVEGKITIHDADALEAGAESSSDGFVFVMPELHPAVSGFEIMLRFLFPVWDTFALYGRPNRLVSDVLDSRGLMFALPKDRKYGYLETLDVSQLIHTPGSNTWTERQWRKEMKDLTSRRMLTMGDDDSGLTMRARKSASRTSLPSTNGGRLRFEDATMSSPYAYQNQMRPDTIPPTMEGSAALRHRRSASEAYGYAMRDPQKRMSGPAGSSDEFAPTPPAHGVPLQAQRLDSQDKLDSASESSARTGSDKTPEQHVPPEVANITAKSPPPGPVAAPPSFSHAPSEKPQARPNPTRGQSDLDRATLYQMADVGQIPPGQLSPSDSPVPQGNTFDHNNQDGGWGGRDQKVADAAAASNMMHANQYRQAPPMSSHNSRNKYPNTRLATIPASPYVDQDATIQSPSSPHFYYPPHLQGQGAQKLPQQRQNGQSPSTPPANDPRLQEYFSPKPPNSPQRSPPRPGSAPSVHRKPIPAQSPPSSRDGQQHPVLHPAASLGIDLTQPNSPERNHVGNQSPKFNPNGGPPPPAHGSPHGSNRPRPPMPGAYPQSGPLRPSPPGSVHGSAPGYGSNPNANAAYNRPPMRTVPMYASGGPIPGMHGSPKYPIPPGAGQQYLNRRPSNSPPGSHQHFPNRGPNTTPPGSSGGAMGIQFSGGPYPDRPSGSPPRVGGPPGAALGGGPTSNPSGNGPQGGMVPYGGQMMSIQAAREQKEIDMQQFGQRYVAEKERMEVTSSARTRAGSGKKGVEDDADWI